MIFAIVIVKSASQRSNAFPNPCVFARYIAKVAADDEEEGVDEKIEFLGMQ
jgi:hypothetical protein